MNASLRSLFVCALALVALVACEQQKSPPPPPAPKVEAPPPPPAVDAEMKRLAGEVFVYAYPIVLMDVTRVVQLAKAQTDTFVHRRNSADAAVSDAAFPNPDFLFSQAWVDLSKGPVVLTVPDTKGRYYLIAMLDAWTNVAASIGKRTTGTEKGEFAIVGPRWKGTLPGGVSEIRSPTEMAWLLGRTRTTGKSDEAAAARIEDAWKLAPLAKRTGKPSPSAAPAATVDAKADPREQVARMDAATFFTRFADLLPGNPPAKEDAPIVDKMKKLGVAAGKPFEMSKLSPLQAASVQEGSKAALDAIASAGKGSGSADVLHGWSVDRDLGRWGVDYGKRAVSAWRGLGVNAPEDAIFMSARFDGLGKRLDGANMYVLHFDRGAPPVDGFWSVTVYDEQKRVVPNRLNRHNLQNDELRANADGSYDVYIGSADPGGDKEANWIPAPKGPFIVMLRVYAPKQEALDGRWMPPGIKAGG